MNIRAAVPTFLVSDVAESTRWYTRNLGFQVLGVVPKDEPYSFASLQRGQGEIMLLALDGYEKPDLRHLRPSGLWDAYFRVDGVNALFETVAGESFIQMPLTEQPYGDWEFEVRDLNGYVLTFGGTY